MQEDRVSPTEFDREFAILNEICPAGFQIGARVRFGQPAMHHSTYPDEWNKQYIESAYFLRDPVVAWAVSAAGSVRWSALEIPDTFGILSAAAEYGLKYGATISIGERHSRTILSISRGDREFTDEEISQAEVAAKEIHSRTGHEKTLTIGQRNALRMIAEGWKYPQAAERLGIAEGALKARLVSVRKALGVETTPEAIMTARSERLI